MTKVLSKKRPLTCVRAFQRIAHACLGDIERGYRSARRGDAEGIHRMRIGFTKLAAARKFFSAMVTDDGWLAIKREIAWLNGILGEARDNDVALAYVREMPKYSLLGVGRREIGRRVSSGHALVTRALASKRYQALLTKILSWIDMGSGQLRRTGRTESCARPRSNGSPRIGSGDGRIGSPGTKTVRSKAAGNIASGSWQSATVTWSRRYPNLASKSPTVDCGKPRRRGSCSAPWATCGIYIVSDAGSMLRARVRSKRARASCRGRPKRRSPNFPDADLRVFPEWTRRREIHMMGHETDFDHISPYPAEGDGHRSGIAAVMGIPELFLRHPAACRR